MSGPFDRQAFFQFTRTYPHNQFELRPPSNWLDCQKHRFAYILEAFLEFRSSLGTNAPSILDVGTYPGSLVKALRLFLKEPGIIEGAGLYNPEELRQEFVDYQIGYHLVNIDPLIGSYSPELPDIPTRVDRPDAFFDVVFATEILEHTLDPMFLMRETFRLLKPGGLFILTTPNQATLSNRLRLLAGKSIYYPLKASMMYDQSDWRPHIREYIPAEMETMLSDVGFSNQSTRYMDISDDDPRIWDWSHPRLRLAKAVGKVFMKIPSLRQNFLVVARKPQGQL